MHMGVIGSNRGLNFFNCRVVDVVVANFQHRGCIAAPHAGGTQNPHLCWIHTLFQRFFQLLRTRQFAGQRIANPDRQRGRWGLAFFDDIKMGVKTGNLIDLGLSGAHLFRKRADVRRGYMTKLILN